MEAEDDSWWIQTQGLATNSPGDRNGTIQYGNSKRYTKTTAPVHTWRPSSTWSTRPSDWIKHRCSHWCFKTPVPHGPPFVRWWHIGENAHRNQGQTLLQMAPVTPDTAFCPPTQTGPKTRRWIKNTESRLVAYFRRKKQGMRQNATLPYSLSRTRCLLWNSCSAFKFWVEAVSVRKLVLCAVFDAQQCRIDLGYFYTSRSVAQT